MQTLIIVYLVLYIIPVFILDYLQLKYIKKYMTKDAVILNQSDYIQAALYGIKRMRLSMAEHLLDILIFVIWIIFGINALSEAIYLLDLPSTTNDLIVVMLFVGINALVSLPLSLYRKKIDTEFGFNKSNLKLMIIDFIKKTLIMTLVLGVLLFALLTMMEHVTFWWLYAFILMFCVALVVNVIYPTIIAPIFNDFTPLKDEELTLKINDLMDKVGFKNSGIFIMDASKRDGRLNAYFGGLGKSKRVVLFDTLINKVSQEGLIAILGHELGHFKHKDILKNLIISAILIFIIFFIMGNFIGEMNEKIGIFSSNASTIIVGIMILPVISFFLMPIVSYFSRKAEYRADEFGAMHSSKRALKEALIRIVNENKLFPYSHPLYIFFYFSHPPLIERLKAIKE